MACLQDNQILDRRSKTELPLRLLIKEKWQLRLLIVFDVCNHLYDAQCGHLPEYNALPVFVVRFSKKGGRAEAATPDLQRRVNRETAEIHNLTGKGSTPPFIVDHTSAVPVYLNPRDIGLLVNESTTTAM